MFLALFTIVFVWTLRAGQSGGPSRAVFAGWIPAAFLLPVWMTFGVGSVVLDLRTAAAIALILTVIAAPGGYKYRPATTDYLIVCLVLVQIASQYQCGSLRPFTVPELSRKWLCPYIAGRLLLNTTSDLRHAVEGFSRVIVILSSLAIFECFSKINIINTILGKTYGLLEQGEGYRWGLKRAHVTFDHPIFFGMALVLMLPWALEALRFAKLKQGPDWWRWLPTIMAAALFSTVSRGPQLAGMATAAMYYFFRIKKLRMPMIAIACMAGIGVANFKEELVQALEVIAGEKTADTDVRIIQIDGEDVEYSGTNHRILLFRVYAEAMNATGMFGFGVELKGVVIDDALAQRFASIDCHYLLFYLQHGNLGLGVFISMTLVILYGVARLGFKTELPQSSLASGLFGALLGVAVLLMSVWFSPDFGGVWLFSAGLAGSLRLLQSDEKSESLKPAFEARSEKKRAKKSSPSAPVRNQNMVANYVEQSSS